MDVSPSGSGTLYLENLSDEGQDAKIEQPTRYPTSYDCFFISHTARVTATAKSGYKFERWILDPAPSGFNAKTNPAVFVTSTPRDLTAVFTSGSSTSPPSAPTNVSASDGTYSNRVRVTWSASSGATSYEINRDTDTIGFPQVLGTTTSTFFDDTPPACDTTYYYWVRAKNSAGDSDLSSPNTGYCDSGGVTPPVDPPAGGVAPLTAIQAKKEIDETLGLVILDIRENNAYVTGHLLCAENAAWNSAFDFINYNVVANYKDIDILIYDQDGTNGLKAANYLASEGFSTVYYISGGLNAWKAKEYETVTTAGPCSIPPMANAGEDQAVAEEAQVSLNGSASASSSGALTYVWTQSSGPSVILLNPKTATPTFTAPPVQEGGEELVFHLKVINAQEVADTDSVSVFVTWSPINSPPVANAGLDRDRNEGVSVTLNANGSTDPDGLSDIVSYSWTQTGGTPLVALSNPGSAVATFTAPEITVTQTILTFRLTVEDAEGEASTDSVQITIKDVPDGPTAPIANAGNPAIVDESTNVTLDGSGSSAPGGTIASYQWTQTGGTNVTLNNSTAAKASFTAPSIDTSQESLTFRLVVTNNTNQSSSDTVTILVQNVSVTGKPPVAHAGTPQTAYGGATVTLNGSMSMDFEGGTITAYQWQQISGPDVSIFDASSPTTTFVAPLPENSSIVLEFQLTVTDNDNNQDTDDVTIVVDASPPPVADAGDDQIVKENKTVILDGSGSTDEGENGIKSYLWEQISGTPVTLSAADEAQVDFEAPKVTGLITLIFELTVENYSGQQSSDMVAITVKNNSSSDSTCFISAIQ